jgi:uncharacterized protein (TIGR03435 family)
VATAGPAGSPRLDVRAAVETSVIVTLHEERRARWPLLIFGLWAALFLYRMFQIVRSYFYLRGLKRSSCVSSQALPPLTRSATLLLSAEVASPMAVGFLRPAVILPESLPDELEQVEMEHVLLHEAAHIARYDDWTNLAVRLLGAALALHPVALWILRQIEREREMACDDWVVARTGSARPYAASLARISEMQWSRRKDFPGLKLASGLLGGGSRVGDRIKMLLKRGRKFSAQVSRARLGASAVMLLAFVGGGSLMPQWIAFAQQTDRLSFDTASVRPFVGSTRIPPTFETQPEGSLAVTGYPLQNLIAKAYDIREEQVLGRRDWMNSDRFSIDARAAGNPGKGELMRMLQTLLEDTFKLKVHRETRELPVFVMTAAKGGLKLGPLKEGGCAGFNPGSSSVAPSSRKYCGLVCNGGCWWHTDGVDMAGLTDFLSTMMGGPVIDKTGFTGKFSLDLEWSQGGFSGARAVLEERLGLQFTKGTGEVEFLVIDQVEKPDAN